MKNQSKAITLAHPNQVFNQLTEDMEQSKGRGKMAAPDMLMFQLILVLLLATGRADAFQSLRTWTKTMSVHQPSTPNSGTPFFISPSSSSNQTKQR